MPNDESMTNDDARRVTFCHSGFVILSSFVIRASSFLVFFLLIFPAASRGEDNLGILGANPRWNVLEKYQGTITHDEFSRLIKDVYCTHGFAPDLIEINEKTARILMNRESQKFFTLRFAKNDSARKPVPRLAVIVQPSGRCAQSSTSRNTRPPGPLSCSLTGR